jgi:antitoxin VapB
MPRRVSLARSGRGQILRIPKDLELPGKEVLIHKRGSQLVVEPLPENESSLLAVLDGLPPIDEEFPDTDEGLLPLDDIEL